MNQVFETAFSGCGFRYAEVRRTRRFRDSVARWRGVPKSHPRSSDLGALFRVGPLVAGNLLNRFSFGEAVARAREEPYAWEYNPEILASIGLFGRMLSIASTATLPETFPKPLTYFERGLVLGGKRETRPPLMSMRKIARGWKGLPAVQRYDIGHRLSMLFGETERTAGGRDDGDPGVESALPQLYGTYIPGRGNRAGCLGKAQMVAGWCRLAEARALSALPLEFLSELHWRKKAQMAETARRFLERMRWPIREQSLRSLDAIQSYGVHRRESRLMHHMTIALATRGGEWMLVDPNFNMHGVFDPTWNLPDVDALIRRVHPVLPGISLIVANDEVYRRYEPDVQLTLANCGRVIEIAEKGFSRRYARDELVDLLAASPFLDEVTKQVEFEMDLPRSVSRRKKAICVLLEYHLDRKDPEEPSAGSRDHRLKFLWFCFRDWSEERLIAELGSDDEAFEAFRTMVFSYCTLGIRNSGMKTDPSLLGRKLQHPLLEFADLEWGLAAATLSHVGIVLGLGDETEAALNHHTFHHRQLVHLAGHPLLSTEPGHRVAESRFAASILRTLPKTTDGARWVLEALTSGVAA